MDAGDIILDSGKKYMERLGREIDVESELVPLVMNLAYLEVCEAKQKGNISDPQEVFDRYHLCAGSIFPDFHNHFDSRLIFGFVQTLKWDGIKDFLVEYFEDKLGWDIRPKLGLEAGSSEILTFNSTNHTRYEQGRMVKNSQADRLITLFFSNNRNRLKVSISTVLSDKIAILIEQSATKLTYNVLYDVVAIPQGSYALYSLLYAVFILFISVFYSWLFQIMLGKVII